MINKSERRGKGVDVRAVAARWALATRCGTADPDVAAALADVPDLLREVRSLRADGRALRGAVRAARMRAANLAAAGRASLAALAEGEHKPWWYLRDELERTP